jgi:hypothetical protein
MEFSLLRFLQLLTCDVNQLKINGFSDYNINRILLNNKLKNFIDDFPKIYKLLENYEYNVKERSKWSETISDMNTIDYYRNDKSELFTSVENIFNFIETFVNINELKNMGDELSFQDKFDMIASNFSTNDKEIKIVLEKTSAKISKVDMKTIIRQVSRPDNEYINYLNEVFNVVDRNTTIYIFVNNKIYEWSLWEKFIVDDKIKNKFITGHSVIKCLN